MTLTGFEPLQKSSGNTTVPASADAESDAHSGNSALQIALDVLAKLTPEQQSALVGMLAERSEGDS